MDGIKYVYERYQPETRFGKTYRLTKRIEGISAKMAHELTESGIDPWGPKDGRMVWREYTDQPIVG